MKDFLDCPEGSFPWKIRQLLENASSAIDPAVAQTWHDLIGDSPPCLSREIQRAAFAILWMGVVVLVVLVVVVVVASTSTSSVVVVLELVLVVVVVVEEEVVVAVVEVGLALKSTKLQQQGRHVPE